MAVGDAYVFPGFLTPVLTQLSFRSHRLLFSHASEEVSSENTPERKFTSTGPQTHNHQVMGLTYFCRGERRKYAGKKSRLNRGSNSQPPGHESDTLTTKPPGREKTFCTKDNDYN